MASYLGLPLVQEQGQRESSGQEEHLLAMGHCLVPGPGQLWALLVALEWGRRLQLFYNLMALQIIGVQPFFLPAWLIW